MSIQNTSSTTTEPVGFADRLNATKAILERIAADFSPAVFASSLAAEDMVLTDLILRDKTDIGIFSLETAAFQPPRWMF